MADDIKFDPDDLDAAKAWLRGAIKKQGSPRDLQARRTLERMLREIPDAVVALLATAIKDGRLVMKRKRGRPQKNAYLIATFVDQKNKAGISVESAVKEAERLGVKRSTIYSARSKWRGRI